MSTDAIQTVPNFFYNPEDSDSRFSVVLPMFIESAIKDGRILHPCTATDIKGKTFSIDRRHLTKGYDALLRMVENDETLTYADFSSLVKNNMSQQRVDHAKTKWSRVAHVVAGHLLCAVTVIALVILLGPIVHGSLLATIALGVGVSILAGLILHVTWNYEGGSIFFNEEQKVCYKRANQLKEIHQVIGSLLSSIVAPTVKVTLAVGSRERSLEIPRSLIG